MIVRALFVVELAWDRLRNAKVGMMEGLWRRPRRRREGGRVRERKGLWRTAKLPLNQKKGFFGLLFLYFSHLIKQIWYCSLERRF